MVLKRVTQRVGPDRPLELGKEEDMRKMECGRRPSIVSLVALTAVAALIPQTVVGAERVVLGEYFTQPN